MTLIKNRNLNVIQLLDGDKVLFQLGFMADEFVWDFYSSKSILLTRDIDESFYNNLNELMNNSYVFGDSLKGISFKEEERLVWLSDVYCDLSDLESINKVSRLIIEKADDAFKISVENPYIDKFDKDNNRGRCIAFSPAGNGVFTKNIDTGTTLQSDVVNYLYLNILYEKCNNKVLKVL